MGQRSSGDQKKKELKKATRGKFQVIKEIAKGELDRGFVTLCTEQQKWIEKTFSSSPKILEVGGIQRS